MHFLVRIGIRFRSRAVVEVDCDTRVIVSLNGPVNVIRLSAHLCEISIWCVYRSETAALCNILLKRYARPECSDGECITSAITWFREAILRVLHSDKNRVDAAVLNLGLIPPTASITTSLFSTNGPVECRPTPISKSPLYVPLPKDVELAG